MERHVLTVTLNAAVDVAYTVPGFAAGAINVAAAVRRVAGGKGNNVARVLARLGVRVAATGFAGGATGWFIQEELRRCGVVPEYVEMAGENRSCYAITDPETGAVTELRERGPQLGTDDVLRFRARFDRLLPGAELVVMSGSLPPGVEPSVYRDLIARARTWQVRAVLDSSGQPLREALAARPYLVKPNRSELADWAGSPLESEADVVAAARRMREAGPEWVMVSLGGDGALLVGPDGAWRAVPPPVRAANTVGSGDSAVAGLACGLVRRAAPEELLRLSVACGTANAMTAGVADVDPADVERVARDIRIVRL